MENVIEVIGVCPFCGKAHSVFANEMGVMAWQNGELIQNALPMLTPTEREQMISGICPDCQKGIFGTDVEEDGEELEELSDDDWLQ